METRENFIRYRESRLHYSVAGHGPSPLLLYHGFGQSHLAFESWIETLGTVYTLYMFDLYFHGQSTWPDHQPVEKKDWANVISLFLETEKIKRFTIAGYSLGGKFALATLEAVPDKVANLLLIAPDGVKTRFTYRLATYPFVARRLFKSMVFYPGRFYRLVAVFRFLRLLNPGVLRFAQSQMDSEEKRRRVYFSWVYFRHLAFDMKAIGAILNTHNVPLTVAVGRFDKVIPPNSMKKLLKHVEKKELVVFEVGHNDLIKNVVGLLARIAEVDPSKSQKFTN